MASFGQVTAALVAATQETSIGLANLHFDFAVIKVEAPHEYHGLGKALSTRHRETAENGALHIIARKLGALFEGVMPKVPELVQAYGLRASEIAKSPEATPQDSARHSVFAEHVGLDGSTIWAAATSGGETVTVHFLACMLARIWAREEAVSIWHEIVESRKAELQADQGSPSDLAKSRIELTREQLDAWDSGARAWLRTADAARMLQQTQLRLLVDNISLPVTRRGAVYDTVIYALIRALEALNNLVKGIPQQIDDGALLLGLSAWHLYPDILMANTNTLVEQKDSLVRKGGIITIGLENKENSGRGVSWSLPLAQAKYYGEPVLAKRHLGIGESKVSFDGLLLVALGSIFRGWRDSTLELEAQMELLEKIGSVICTKPEAQGKNSWHRVARDKVDWLPCLVDAAVEYKRSDDVIKDYKSRLVSFGKRACDRFIAKRRQEPAPVFGLTNFRVLLQSCKDHKERLNLLRNWAVGELDSEILSKVLVVYKKDMYTIQMCEKLEDDTDPPAKRHKVHRRTQRLSMTWRPFENNELLSLQLIDDGLTRSNSTSSVMIRPGPISDPEPHVLLCGDPQLIALYVPVEPKTLSPTLKHLTVAQFERLLDEGHLQHECLRKATRAVSAEARCAPYFESLRALAVAAGIYAPLPGARVHLKVTSKPLTTSSWWHELKADTPQLLQTAFSCIAYLETGVIDLAPKTIGDQAFAVCFETSIFVADSLLKDPRESQDGFAVEWLLGNVGKPGLAFLITPPDPKIRKFDYSSWHMISHEPFRGTPEDNFKGTSFHLSFTGYQPAINLGGGGSRETPAYFLETAISVHDKGKWVADVEILKSSTRWQIMSELLECIHTDSCRAEALSALSMACVDSWVEFLDPPSGTAVVRAHGNPAARLAAASLALRMSKNVHVMGQSPCWACYLEDESDRKAARLGNDAAARPNMARTDPFPERATMFPGATVNVNEDAWDTDETSDSNDGDEPALNMHDEIGSNDGLNEDDAYYANDEFHAEEYAFNMPPAEIGYQNPQCKKRKRASGKTDLVIIIH